jgi:transcriptional regulator with XRE-family HTH domain
MEKDKKIREYLGMKQEDMAMLLQVTRTQWSMYEIGERDLPLAAKNQLASMLAFIHQTETTSTENFPHLESQQAKIKKVYEDQKLVNAHRQIMVARKLELVTKKYEDAMTGLKFIRFLELHEAQLYQKHQELLKVLQRRAEEAVHKNGLHVQAKYQLKLHVLQQEEVLLNNAL